jgi:hypothetical protein
MFQPGGGLPVLTGWSASAEIDNVSHGTATASFIANPDGTWSATSRATNNTVFGSSSSGSWYAPTTSGIGSSYWMKLVRASGNGGEATGNFNSYQSLAAAVTWSIVAPASTISVQSYSYADTYNIYMASDSSGTNETLVGSVFLSANTVYAGN